MVFQHYIPSISALVDAYLCHDSVDEHGYILTIGVILALGGNRWNDAFYGSFSCNSNFINDETRWNKRFVYFQERRAYYALSFLIYGLCFLGAFYVADTSVPYVYCCYGNGFGSLDFCNCFDQSKMENKCPCRRNGRFLRIHFRCLLPHSDKSCLAFRSSSLYFGISSTFAPRTESTYARTGFSRVSGWLCLSIYTKFLFLKVDSQLKVVYIPFLQYIYNNLSVDCCLQT